MVKKFKNVFMIVADSMGIGKDQKQESFGDNGANTFLHVWQNYDLQIPNLKKLGIEALVSLKDKNEDLKPQAYVGKIFAKSNAKDTLAGHWEMMGIQTKVANPNFIEKGFPDELIKELEKAFDGRKIIGNENASGTEILKRLAHREIENNEIIVYTSPDSTLQICGHEEHMGLENLYRYAKAARQICSSKSIWNVARVIARPYVGQNGSYTRTFNRHDYANKPSETLLNSLQKAKIQTIAVGKINDIFVGQAIDKVYPPASDVENMDVAIEIAKTKKENQFVFVNLVEFDSHYGHRRDVIGYGKNIDSFDKKLGELLEVLSDDDLLIITADHGNDPTFPGSSHTREALPLIVYSKAFKNPSYLKTLLGLGTSGNIVARNFGLKTIETGEDIWDKLK
ncbi:PHOSPHOPENTOMUTASE (PHOSPHODEOXYRIBOMUTASE) [Mycoplasmopsis pulmonis]|uniref:Phosphopentomutase n=1 Tax=Mycoplasmopsis pulmonis (strain UAB CTIP) TaxID=272635 RepID=DEOB_MYCPU|nr:phosphopentomutase [Mycoplasmopsis pulmonis]Q98QT4.1 RecName: Full=Phosphopentomutase; AltName: Full=Phosphodeoxyribomutase [Mycoplasmopsis pulmonis UAB CTIP]MDZ7293236.1 phosphopentomutase [Mycoplasmopsis pulmonis]CAC13450.1 PHOSPHOPENTOMUTASE (PHOSPHODEOXYRIBOMUTASE) [Mycoplasmopsis pulmonis]VEU68038.1 Phosphopentomutase [Mycoplasmopsis pulmonis]